MVWRIVVLAARAIFVSGATLARNGAVIAERTGLGRVITGDHPVTARATAEALSLLAVFYAPFLQPIFETEAISAWHWLGIGGLSLTPLVVVEAIKLSGLAQRLEPAELTAKT